MKKIGPKCDLIFRTVNMQRLLLLASVGATLGYELGEDTTLCWVSNVSTAATREQCAGVSVNFISTLSAILPSSGRAVEYELVRTAALTRARRL